MCTSREYYVSNSGTFFWKDCNAIDRNEYFPTGTLLCVCNVNTLPVSFDGGTGYLTGGGCTCQPPILPSLTPSVTPSVSRTPSLTPSVTPSVSRTPSVTPTRTPSVTPSVTPSTSIIPITLSVTAFCDEPVYNGNGRIYANAFGGGTNSFDYITISAISAADALSRLDNSATRTFIGGATEYNFTGLINDTYYVAIMDTAGNKGVSTAVVVSCIAPSPTPSRTPTVTPSVSRTPSSTPAPTPSLTPTRTPSLTPTPTPSAALGYAFVDIANNTAGTSITNITVNGVQVDGAVFPIVAGDGASATTTQTGASRTIVVSYTNISNDSVEVIDTASNVTCISATSTSRTFSGQVVSDAGTVTISMFDGSCP